MKLLVTGGCGFIGSNLIRLLLEERPEVEVVNLDLLTYAGNPANLADIQTDPRYTFVHGDICDGDLVRSLVEGMDGVLNLAAESHVDRSIREAAPFVRTNVLGTQVLLDAARKAGVPRFLQVSTDEVYGELPWVDPETGQDGSGESVPSPPRFTEDTPLNPRSPYSASKAGADLLTLSYHATYQMDVIIARGSNNFGPYQYPEKLIPRMIARALAGDPLPVYGDGLNVRDWIFVEDFCRGILAAFEKGRSGEAYNFGGDSERTNLHVVNGILDVLGADSGLVSFVEDRLGHDRRYAVDFSKATTELGWNPEIGFRSGLKQTVAWYINHPRWCEAAG